MWAAVSMLVYCAVDLMNTIGGYKLGNALAFVRGIAIIAFLYICAAGLKGLWEKNIVTRWVHGLLCDCSQFSLQMYLFNGYLMTAFRVLICQVLHIEIPVVIVLGIWIGDVAVTLAVCRWVIPRVMIGKFLCGMTKNAS